jgi:hypothetical protein
MEVPRQNLHPSGNASGVYDVVTMSPKCYKNVTTATFTATFLRFKA